MKKNQAVLLGAALIAVIAVAGSGIFWLFIMSDVDFWLDPNCYYQKTAGDWGTFNYANNSCLNGTYIPINCKNNGALTATFVITIVFTDASFSTNTPSPYQPINNTAAKFSFTLNSHQEKNTNVYFTIENTTYFTVSLSLKTNQSLLRITNAQKSSEPWDRSYRELSYSQVTSDKFVAAVIS